jgi:hypothetical protein
MARTDASGSNTGLYVFMAVILLLLVFALLWFGGVVGGGDRGTRNIDADIRIETPDVGGGGQTAPAMGGGGQ